MINSKVADDLNTLASRDDIPDDVKFQVTEAAKELRSPIETDVWIYRAVVSVLGIIALVTVIGGITITLTVQDTSISLPDAIVALGSAAVGALAGLLAPSPNR